MLQNSSSVENQHYKLAQSGREISIWMSCAVGCNREASLEWLSCRCELIWFWWSKCPHSATEKWEGESKWWCSCWLYSSTCCCIWTHRGGSRPYPKRCESYCALQITLLGGTWENLILVCSELKMKVCRNAHISFDMSVCLVPVYLRTWMELRECLWLCCACMLFNVAASF